MNYLTKAQKWQRIARQVKNSRAVAQQATRTKGKSPPTEYKEWLKALFPQTYAADLAPYHDEFWAWLWQCKKHSRPKPFFAIWSRGWGKTTNAEVACVALAAKGYKYILYVKSKQEQADDAITNIAQRLESDNVNAYYPNLSDKKLNKFGNSKGWRRNRLWTESGTIFDGIGLDVAKRGAKLGDSRPDAIIFDDIDELHDSRATTQKKILTIAKSLLPAGSEDLLVMGFQNLIIKHGIFSQLAEQNAKTNVDFLVNRIVSGPHPAIYNLTYEQRYDEVLKRNRYIITSGQPSWGFMSLEKCQAMIDDEGITAFIQERQHEVNDQDGGMFSHIDYEHIDFDDMPQLEDVQCWLDVAVTSKDSSDSQAISIMGKASNKVYDIFAWEGIDSPSNVLKRAIVKAVELKASIFGIETNQGGDLWKQAFDNAWDELIITGEISKAQPKPRYKEYKVTQADGNKRFRWQQMLAEGYEQGKIIHVLGTHGIVEASLKRLPDYKPFDLADARWHCWHRLSQQSSTFHEMLGTFSPY